MILKDVRWKLNDVTIMPIIPGSFFVDQAHISQTLTVAAIIMFHQL